MVHPSVSYVFFFFGGCHPQTLWRLGTCSSHSSSAYASLNPHIPPMPCIFRIHSPDRSRIPESGCPSFLPRSNRHWMHFSLSFSVRFPSSFGMERDGVSIRKGRLKGDVDPSSEAIVLFTPLQSRRREASSSIVSVPAPPPSWKVGDTSKTKGCRKTPLRSSGACKGIESADGNPLENKGRRSNSPARRCDGWESKTPGKDTVVASIASHGTKREPSSCRVRTIDA